MAKRFTDTNKYKKQFMRSLPGAYKILWDFLYHDCDNSGIWTVDFETAQIYVGKDMVVTREKALELFNHEEVRVIEIDRGKKWFLPGFIGFQYGELSAACKPHKPVISALQKFNLLTTDLKLLNESKGYTNPLERVKDMDKEKEMEKDKEKEGGVGDFSTIAARLDTAFNDLYLEPLSMKAPTLYPGVDFNLELERFKQKVKGSPRVYANRDSDGLRAAFEFQLRCAPVKIQNRKYESNVKSTPRTSANAIVEASTTGFGKL